MKDINRNTFINHGRNNLKSKNSYKYNHNETESDLLSEYTAIVTGAGMETGYSSALALLRSGAEVIAVTDFPYNALKKYSDEYDFDLWKDRLYLYELDFRNVKEIRKFINYIKDEFKSIDIIINNASQSVKKSIDYYIEMGKTEKLYEIEAAEKKLDYNMIKSSEKNSFIKENIYSRLSLHDIDSYDMSVRMNEFMEMQTINSALPYFMISELKSCLLDSLHKNKFIINVIPVNITSSKDENIYGSMAETSLNTLTKSFGDSLSKENIFIYSVNTGLSMEESIEDFNNRKDKNSELSSIYDEAAAKICSPIFKHLKEDSVQDFGKVL